MNSDARRERFEENRAKYEGDLKAALVEEIAPYSKVLGLNLSRKEIELIVDSKVTQMIGELLEFNHIYQMHQVHDTKPGE